MRPCLSQAGWLLRILGGLQGVEGVAPCGRPALFGTRDDALFRRVRCGGAWCDGESPGARVRGKSRIEKRQIGTVIGRQRSWRFRKPLPKVFSTQRFPESFDALTALTKKFFIWDLREQGTSCLPSCGRLREMLLPIPFCPNRGSPRRFPFGGMSCVSPSRPALEYLEASTSRHSTGSVGAPREGAVSGGGARGSWGHAAWRLAAADDRHIPLKT